MTASLFVVCLAAAAIVAFSASALGAIGMRLTTRSLARRTPAARARIAFGLAVLPAIAAIVLMVAALSPTFGWVADHCLEAGGHGHGHRHICARHAQLLPAVPIVTLAVLLALRLMFAWGGAIALGVSALVTTRALTRTAQRGPDGTLVLPIGAPHAFVIGVFRPRMFVTRGLLAPDVEAHVPVVMAHERAHIRRADALVRTIARAAAAFHLPFVATTVERQLAEAQEMAADEAAAEAVQSRERVADALVALARRRPTIPRAAHTFGATAIEARVCALLDDGARLDNPSRAAFAGVAAAVVVAVAIGAESVHHGVEMLLGLLGG